MNEKVERALMLIDQMLDFGDCPIGLFEVRRLLAEAQAADDEVEAHSIPSDLLAELETTLNEPQEDGEYLDP